MIHLKAYHDSCVIVQVALLFRSHDDLLQEFTYFLPDSSVPQVCTLLCAYKPKAAYTLMQSVPILISSCSTIYARIHQALCHNSCSSHTYCSKSPGSDSLLTHSFLTLTCSDKARNGVIGSADAASCLPACGQPQQRAQPPPDARQCQAWCIPTPCSI